MSLSIEPISVAEAVGTHLRARLLSGDYEAGQEIKDTTLARELNVARPTARMAVQRLVSEGLLERPAGHSARVRTFTADDVVDIYRMRRLLEFEAVRIVTEHDLDTTAVSDALQNFKAVGGDVTWEAWPDADTRFHTAVVRCAGSNRLARMFDSLAAEMRLMVALLRPRYGALGELYDEHAALLRVLQSGRTSAALQQWADHLDDAQAYLVSSGRAQGESSKETP